MSLKDLRSKSQTAMDSVQATPSPNNTAARPVTSPGATALMQPTIDALNDRAKRAEALVKELEAQVADIDSIRVELEKITPNPWQPRRVFDVVEIEKLATSIAEVGLIQPVVLRRVQNLDTFQIVAGERRVRAHRTLSKADIKAVIVDVSDSDMAAMALAENMDRQDLTAFEIAIAIKNAEEAFPDRKAMASALGIQRSDLYRYLAFFKLPKFIIDDLDVTPGLLGRDAAEAIVAVLKQFGKPAEDVVSRIWTRVKSGDIDQGKAASLIAASLAGKTVSANKEVQKLFSGKDNVGAIVSDGKRFKVTIDAKALTAEKEIELRRFLEGLLS